MTPRSMTLDDIELLKFEFSVILQIWDALQTAKRMKIDAYCQRQRCNQLNVGCFYRAMHFSTKRGSAVLRSHVVCMSVCLSVCDVGGM